MHDNQEPQVHKARLWLSSSSRHDLSRIRALVADDNAVNRFILSHMLGLTNAEVIVVRDGREAVDTWKQQPFDIMLLDISMPNMDGVAALAEICDHEVASGRSSPIALAVTAHTMPHEMNGYLAAGFSGIVPKPLRLTTLYEEICSALAAQEGTQPERRQAI
jgi:CheY-like chemotaxis protein